MTLISGFFLSSAFRKFGSYLNPRRILVAPQRHSLSMPVDVDLADTFTA